MGSTKPATLMRVLPVADLPANTAPPKLNPEEIDTLLAGMLRIRLVDEKLLLLQRQGRIAFSGPATGQEAAIVGSGFVARKQDWIFPALREGGILLMRGFPLKLYLSQLMGRDLDRARGRQQPMHFSSAEKHFVSLSSVIATQLPQAVGAALAARLKGDDCVVFGYLGDGATSEHDFHSALNFASVFKAPCLFICQNNQWAISVPFSRQTASSGVAIKAKAYGLPGVAVDGNDVLAVVKSVQEAHQRAREGGGASLIELVTWRRGGHSSSDDPTRYRDESKTPLWLAKDPIERLEEWMQEQGLHDPKRIKTLRTSLKQELEAAIKLAEASPPPPPESLFEDVYQHLPPHLQQQKLQGLGDSGTQEIKGAFPL